MAEAGRRRIRSSGKSSSSVSLKTTVRDVDNHSKKDHSSNCASNNNNNARIEMKADLNFIRIVRDNWLRGRLTLPRFTFFLFKAISIIAVSSSSWEIDILVLTARTKANLPAFTRIVGDTASLAIPPCLTQT